uniref:Uncharacterized protein n=1 Tax=Strigamia maritima TaxID=126957 RepID=T1IKM0_STRMM
MLCIFIILAVAFSFAEAANVCYENSMFSDLLKPIDVKCRAEIKSLPKHTQRLHECYKAFQMCYNREMGVQNDRKGFDHEKILSYMKGFNSTELLRKNTKKCAAFSTFEQMEDYLDCFAEQCPENAKVRIEFVRSAFDACSN